MSLLSLLLVYKITGTLLFIAAPFLLLSVKRLETATGMTARTPTFFRLYGVAMLALTIAYIWGAMLAEAGQMPWGILVMGLVSNGGALIVFALTGTLRRQPWMTLFLASVTLGLILSLIFPTIALGSGS